MISGVTKEIGGASETFRLTTRAMMALDDWAKNEWLKDGGAAEDAPGIIELLAGLEKGFRIATVVKLLAESANNGEGRDIPWAQKAIDEIGMAAAVDLVGKTTEAAFPEATDAGKNPKRAAPSK